MYRAIGADLAALGINFDLAPCADVLGSADSPAVGTRSFGADTGLVSRHTAAAVAGLQGAGVAACTKHFPGHGRTGTDTHEAIATIEGGLAELRRRDLPPFEAAIRAGTIAIMPSHLRVPELTGDLPATVSGAALTGLLRGELGFTGVIVSDALEMRATRDMFGIPGAAVLAVAAGTDLLCLGRDGSEDEYLAVREALVAAVRDGTLDGARLEEAADRVARLRGGLARTRLPGLDDGGVPADGLVSGGRGPGQDRAGRGPARGAGLRAAADAQPPGDHRGRAAGEHRRGTVRVGAGPVGAGRQHPPGQCSWVTAKGPRTRRGSWRPRPGARWSWWCATRTGTRTRGPWSRPCSRRAPIWSWWRWACRCWRPPAGTSYLATYGASRASAHAAAELLGLA